MERNVVRVAKSGEKLILLVREFVRECASNGIRVNTTKSEVRRIGGCYYMVRGEIRCRDRDEKFEVGEEFKYWKCY